LHSPAHAKSFAKNIGELNVKKSRDYASGRRRNAAARIAIFSETSHIFSKLYHRKKTLLLPRTIAYGDLRGKLF